MAPETRGIVKLWSCARSVRRATWWWMWALSPSPGQSSSQESASWLVRELSVEVRVRASVSPTSENISVRLSVLFMEAHTLLVGVGPQVWRRGALSGGAQIQNCSGCRQSLFLMSCPWTDWCIRSYKERNSPHQWQKKGIFSSKCRKLPFCNLLATEFHTL